MEKVPIITKKITAESQTAQKKLYLVFAFWSMAESHSSLPRASLTALEWQSTWTRLKCDTVVYPINFRAAGSKGSTGHGAVKV